MQRGDAPGLCGLWGVVFRANPVRYGSAERKNGWGCKTMDAVAITQEEEAFALVGD